MKIVEQFPEIPDFAGDTRLYEKGTLYFDIETTGLNARRSHLYLLGAMWLEQGTLQLRQWFAERPADEETMLRDFLSLARSFPRLVHFNGSTFDIPYLCHKAAFYGLDAQALQQKGTDLYLLYRPLKAILSAANMKLAPLQKLCGYLRQDHHTGQELIGVYDAYLQTADSAVQKTLERHNYDDIVGMLWLEQLDAVLKLQKEALKPVEVTVSGENEARLTLVCRYGVPLFSLPEPVCFGDILLSMDSNQCTLHIPLIQGEFFYYL